MDPWDLLACDLEVVSLDRKPYIHGLTFQAPNSSMFLCFHSLHLVFLVGQEILMLLQKPVHQNLVKSGEPLRGRT